MVQVSGTALIGVALIIVDIYVLPTTTSTDIAAASMIGI